MRVFIRASGDLGRIPLAGVSSHDRMAGFFATIDPNPVFLEVGESLSEHELSGECLWIEGWFPLLRQERFDDFISFAKEAGDALLPGNVPHTGICYSKEHASHAPVWCQKREGLAVYKQTQKVLADASSLGDINRTAYAREAARVSAQGALLLCPEQTFVDVGVEIAAGAVIGPNVTLKGTTTIASGAKIDMGSSLTNVTIAENAHIKPYCVLEDAEVGANAGVGPFAHIRPGSKLGPESKVGNFVETKKARLGKGSKASHLTYLGDAEIGDDCNIGAGTITCNYDGFNKSLTKLGDGVFIGSNSQLVAPVNIGDGGYVAAGSTVVDDVPADALAIGRSRQVTKAGLAKRIRDKARRKKEAAQNKNE